jgi:hypothetical protein
MRNFTTLFLVSVFCCGAQATRDDAFMNDPGSIQGNQRNIALPLRVTIETLALKIMDQNLRDQISAHPGKALKGFNLSAVKDRRVVKQYSIDVMFPETGPSTMPDGVYAIQITLDSEKKPTPQVLRKLVNKQQFIRTKIEAQCRIVADKFDSFEKVACPEAMQVALRLLPTISSEQVGRLVDLGPFFENREPMVSWAGRLNFNAILGIAYLFRK